MRHYYLLSLSLLLMIQGIGDERSAEERKEQDHAEIALNSEPANQPKTSQKPSQAPRRSPKRTTSARSSTPQHRRAAQRSTALQAQGSSPSAPRKRAYLSSSSQQQRERGRLQAQQSNPKAVISSSQSESATPKPVPPTPEQSPLKLPPAINIPARPVVKGGWNLWVMGEALLWQAVQDNMEYIYKGHDGSDNLRVRDIKKPHFDWDWGWRLGTGYNIPRDGWDLSLAWTHIENHAKGTTHAGDEHLYSVWSVTSHAGDIGTGSEARGNWDIHLDQVDLNLGREFYVGRYLTLCPNAGMRSAWIFQDYHIHFEGSNGAEKNHLTNRFWGLGFFAGVDSNWMLGGGFSVYGDAGLAILLGFFDVDQHSSFNGSTTSKIEKSFRAGRPIFDLDLGLKWAKKFHRERFAFTLKLGYEYHLYFNQNQFLLSNGSDTFELFNPINGDLTYQGAVFSGQFDF